MFLVWRLHSPSLEIFDLSKQHGNTSSFEHMPCRFDFCNQNVGFFFAAQSSYYFIHLKDKSTIMGHFIKVFSGQLLAAIQKL